MLCCGVQIWRHARGARGAAAGWRCAHTLASAPLDAPEVAGNRRRRPPPTPAVCQLAWTCDNSRVGHTPHAQASMMCITKMSHSWLSVSIHCKTAPTQHLSCVRVDDTITCLCTGSQVSERVWWVASQVVAALSDNTVRVWDLAALGEAGAGETEDSVAKCLILRAHTSHVSAADTP